MVGDQSEKRCLAPRYGRQDESCGEQAGINALVATGVACDSIAEER